MNPLLFMIGTKMNKFYIGLISLFFLLLSFASGLYADSPSPYQAQLPIVTAESSPSADEIKVGLAQVLSRMTGEQDISNNPAWKETLSHAPDWMLSYQYSSSPTAPLVVQIDFDPNAINQALKAKGKTPALNATQPQQLLVWLAIQNDSEQHLVGSSSQSTYAHSLDTAADTRGLKLEWPLLDLTDLNVLTFDQVWNSDWSVIDTASKRYPHETVLLIRLSKGVGDGALWTSQWSLKTKTKITTWSFTANDADDALQGGIAQLASLMAQQPIPTVTTATTEVGAAAAPVQLAIYGISDLSVLDGIKSNLQQLPGVQQVDVTELSPNEALLTIVCQGGSPALQQAIADQMHTLAKIQNPDSGSADNQDVLTYQWVL